MVHTLVAFLAFALVACGSGETSRKPGAEGASSSLVEEAGGRAAVATVNGVPIYEDCVKMQAAALGIDARAALEQCVEFALLAQAAAPRYANDRDVREARRREAVRALLRKDFEPSSDDPSDIPEPWVRDNLWSNRKIKIGYDHPEYRVATFALAKFKPIGPKRILTPAHDAEMRKLAEEWDAALPRMVDLDTFQTITKKVAGDRPFDFVDAYNTPLRGRSVNEFADGLFSLEKIGQRTGVVRSDYGYFIIVLREILPAKHLTLEEALPDLREKIYDQWRPRAFADFVEGLVAKATIETHEEALPKVRLDIPSAFKPTP